MIVRQSRDVPPGGYRESFLARNRPARWPKPSARTVGGFFVTSARCTPVTSGVLSSRIRGKMKGAVAFQPRLRLVERQGRAATTLGPDITLEPEPAANAAPTSERAPLRSRRSRSLPPREPSTPTLRSRTVASVCETQRRESSCQHLLPASSTGCSASTEPR